MDAPGEIIQLKVRLLGISPMIWRRVMVPTTMTLHELHGVLQVAMGWESIHLYTFDIYGVQYGSFELMMGSPRVPLAQFSFGDHLKAWGNCVLLLMLAGIAYVFCPQNFPAKDPPFRDQPDDLAAGADFGITGQRFR